MKIFIIYIVAAIFAVQQLTACSLRKRAEETPVPNEQNIEKSFFSNESGEPKRFLVGWAPEEYQGAIAEQIVTYMAQETLHINIEFEVTERSLIGLAVNPSFPNNRQKWEKVIEIPIQSHYYYEKSKDQYGRDTNETIENSNRSHWSRRPFVKLDLSGIQVNKMAFSLLPVADGVHQYNVKSVSDIEWDKSKNFLGFSMNVSHSIYGSDLSITYRFNFLEFKSDKNFKATPYHQDNAKFFNALHSVSKKVEEGDTKDKQIMHVARWDFSQPQDLYLNNVPAKYIPLFKESVQEWEKALQKIGALKPGQNAFLVHDKSPSKHGFDLRYPSIYWYDDKRYAYSQGTLGIALNNVDVTNGKMLAGNVIIYGGALEHYINQNSSVSGSQSNAESFAYVSPKLFPNLQFSSLDLTPKLAQKEAQATTELSRTLISKLQKQMELILQSGESHTAEAIQLKNKLQEELKSFRVDQGQSDIARQIIRTIPTLPHDATSSPMTFQQEPSSLQQFSLMDLRERMNFTFLPAQEKAQKFFSQEMQKRMLIKKNLWGQSAFVREDESLDKIIPAAHAAMSSGQKPYGQVLDGVIKKILVHELGHFLGLGHQFKGTVVPEEGTLPKIFTNAPENKNNKRTLLARSLEENQQTNYSSIMDYLSGRSAVSLDSSEVVPGPHDELVLRYIYKSEIPLFNKEQDRFDYVTLAEINEHNRGRIPEVVKGKRVAYFPACNDYDASLNKDPFCNRWDAGTTAQEIVKSYAREMNDNIINTLFNLTNDSSGVYTAEWSLFARSFDIFSHIRTFYEQLRYSLRTLPSKDNNYWERLRKDEDSLFAFSQACKANSEAEIQGDLLKEIMSNAKIKELCLASLETLDLMEKYISLPPVDYSRINEDSRYMHGGYIAGEGETDWEKYIGGKWYQLNNSGLKIASLFTLTTASPFIIWGGSLIDNPFYDYAENRNLYRTLFPKEVATIFSKTLKNNLRFGPLDSEGKTLLGTASMSLGYFNLMLSNQYGNESNRFNDNYNAILNSQTNFTFSLAAIIVKKVDPTSGKPNMIKQFTAEVFDFDDMKSISVRDAYILRHGRVIVRANGMFLYPLTRLRFYKDGEAYAIAYKISYDSQQRNDPLLEISAKRELSRLHDQIVDACIEGTNRSGLSGYFGGGDGSKFEGFEIQPGIASDTNPGKRHQFEKSIDDEFVKYEAYAKAQDPLSRQTMTYKCDEALRGMGLIVSMSALLNGYWLGITGNYVER